MSSKTADVTSILLIATKAPQLLGSNCPPNHLKPMTAIPPLRILALSFFVTVVGRAVAQEPIRWSVQTSMDGQLFPSLIYAMANLKAQTVQVGDRTVRQIPPDMAPLQTFAKTPLRVTFSRLAPGSKASIRVKSETIMEPLSLVVDLSRERVVSLPLKFKYDSLLAVRQSKPVNVEVSVSIDGASYRTQTKTLTMRSINDCPYFVVTEPSSGKGYELRWMFAAYVNEDHPLVDQILKAALATNIVGQFDGYQSKNVEQVRAQVRAVWTALCLSGVTYSSITATANRSEIAFSQHVRLLGESVKSDQANCVDGSVLIASVLEKIGIETELVNIPGHMFVRFWLDPWLGDDRKHFVCLETTMMGDGFPLPAKTPKAKAIEVADASYVRSWKYANENFDKHAKNFSSSRDPTYKIINVAESRKRGVIPIPYTRPAAPARSP